MRLLRQQLRGITRFTSDTPVSIDWDALGEGIIAIIGRNGAGKSAILETSPASLYEVVPCRGKGASLYDVAHGRDAFVETLWEDNGDKLRVLVKIDAEKRKTERLFEINGSTVAASAKDFAVEIEKRFGSKELFLASVFMAQNKAGAFLKLEKAQRKELFAELLLLGRYEELAQLAGIWQTAAQKSLDDVRSRLSVMHSELEMLPAYEAELSALEENLTGVVAGLDAARLVEDDVRDNLARAQRAQERLAMLTTTRQACFSTWNAGEQTVTQILQKRSDVTARAQERLAAINARRTEDLAPAARNRHAVAVTGLQGRRSRLEALVAQRPAIDKAEAELPVLIDERAGLDARVLEATLLSGRVQEKAAETAVIKRRLEDLDSLKSRREAAMSGFDARQERLQELTQQVPEILEAERALAAIFRERAEIEATVVAATSLRHRVQSKSVEVNAAERRIKDRKQAIEAETVRLTRQTELLSRVPCAVTDEWFRTPADNVIPAGDIASEDMIDADLAGTCPLLKDARAAGAELEALKNKSADPANEVETLSRELEVLVGDAGRAAEEAETARKRQGAIGDEESRLKEIAGRKFAATNASRDLESVTNERQTFERQILAEVARITQGRTEPGQMMRETLANGVGAVSAMIETIRTEVGLALSTLQQEFETLKVEQDGMAPQANADVVRLQIVREEIARLNTVLSDKARIVDAGAELGNIGLEQNALDEGLEHDLTAAREAVKQAESDRRGVEVDRTAAIEAADTAMAQAAADRDVAKAAFDKADLELSQAQTQIGDTDILKQRLKEVEAARTSLESEQRQINSQLAELRARIELLRHKQDNQRLIEAEARDAEQEIGDWRMLAQGSGKDGVQALEIDAAGPEVARIANELLSSCYGPRFSITFETLREKITKPGEFSEAFDITVYDGGEDRKVQLISGGEQVIIGRAIGLAVAIFNGQKNNVRYLDLFEDESVGALDQRQDAEGMTTAQRYVLMLRQARILGKFFQIRTVMHQPEVFSMVDCRLLVENGQVTIDRGEVLAA